MADKKMVGGGSAATLRNLLEVHTDGSLENAHVARLEARVANLELRTQGVVQGRRLLPSCMKNACQTNCFVTGVELVSL